MDTDEICHALFLETDVAVGVHCGLVPLLGEEIDVQLDELVILCLAVILLGEHAQGQQKRTGKEYTFHGALRSGLFGMARSHSYNSIPGTGTARV